MVNHALDQDLIDEVLSQVERFRRKRAELGDICNMRRFTAVNIAKVAFILWAEDVGKSPDAMLETFAADLNRVKRRILK